jgi:hypothetical protein
MSRELKRNPVLEIVVDAVNVNAVQMPANVECAKRASAEDLGLRPGKDLLLS